MPVPTNPFDIKAKQARGNLKTCLESMSNFLHQKLTEQPSANLSIQSPNEQPIPPQGSSSPSFLNDQEQQILHTNHQRQTSLDERIRSIFDPLSKEGKTSKESKESSKPTVRKSLPLPPGTSHSKKDDKHTASKKRSASYGGKSNHRKPSSSSNTKRVSSSATSSSTRKSSSSTTKKSRDSKVIRFFHLDFYQNAFHLASCEYKNNI